MARILVGVDGSEHSKRALRWAIEEAQLRDARVTMVHAYEPARVRSPYTYSYSAMPGTLTDDLREQEREWRQQQEEQVRQHAESAAARILESVVDTPKRGQVETLVVPRDPADVLVELSRNADLLVMGSRGYGGFKGLLLGSVSQKCVSHSRCPVVILR